jgi:hypothetical protein
MADSTDQPRCDSCGQFVDCATARLKFTPLNEFGPEEEEWTCSLCLEAERSWIVARG